MWHNMSAAFGATNASLQFNCFGIQLNIIFIKFLIFHRQVKLHCKVIWKAEKTA